MEHVRVGPPGSQTQQEGREEHSGTRPNVSDRITGKTMGNNNRDKDGDIFNNLTGDERNDSKV